MEGQLKKLKTDYYKIPYFQIQYKSILLLLHFGIGDLPFELVLMILKDHVYVPPIRISLWCAEKIPCLHIVEGKGTMDQVDIHNLCVSNGITPPEHFQLISKVYGYL